MTEALSDDAMSRRAILAGAATAAALPLMGGSAQAQTRAPTTETTARLRFENWSSGRVQVGDVAMFYRYAGNGPPVVLLHGWPQHSLMWHTIGPVLAERFTVIAPDQRGVGMSTITPSGYDKTTMAKDLAGLLDRLGVSEVYLAGYDLGAGSAAAFAGDNPQRVKRIAFMEFGLPGFGYEQFIDAVEGLDAEFELAPRPVHRARRRRVDAARTRARAAVLVLLPLRLFRQHIGECGALRGLRA
jgi:pimeloyl-ACP methyl ester carboxylesterase